MKQIVNLSGGKDSTAMLHLMLEHGDRIDEVLFCDTTAEFPGMYEHLNEVEQKTGIKITRLKPDRDYHFNLTEYIITRTKSKLKEGIKGYGWCSPRQQARWCTVLFKRQASAKYLNAKYGKGNYCNVIGIALDEEKRCQHDLLKAGVVRYPLIEHGFTEEMALNYCKSIGYTWGGLYEKFKRVSC